MVRRVLTGTSGCVVLRGNNRIPDSFLTASQWPIFWRNARGETSEAVPAHESQLCVFAMLPCFFCVWVNCGSGGISAPPRTCIHAWSISFPHLAAFSVSVCFCHFLPTNSRPCPASLAFYPHANRFLRHENQSFWITQNSTLLFACLQETRVWFWLICLCDFTSLATEEW